MATKKQPDILHKVPGWAPEHGGTGLTPEETAIWYANKAKSDAEEARKGKRK